MDKPIDMEQRFDINKVSFNNVSSEFERKFKERYSNSLNMIAKKDDFKSASGTNSLGILEEMARRIDDYNASTDFEETYRQLINEYEPFTES